MQVDTETFLRLTEQSGTLLFFDMETTHLKGDMGSCLVFSYRPYKQKATSLVVDKVGSDRKVMKEAKQILEDADGWVTYNGKEFDIKFLNTRLLSHSIPPVLKRPHLDLYQQLKPKIRTVSKRMAHLADWLELEDKKMSVSINDWAVAASNWDRVRTTMKRRCESDCKVLEDLYDRSRGFIGDIRR